MSSTTTKNPDGTVTTVTTWTISASIRPEEVGTTRDETTTGPPCILCGQAVGSKNPTKYPYCRHCHYVGSAEMDIRAAQMHDMQMMIGPAFTVDIEHTGGGCFWLAIRPVDGAETDPYWILTDGEACLPDDGTDERNAVRGGWGYVGRQVDYVMDEDGELEDTQEFYVSLYGPDYDAMVDYTKGLTDRQAALMVLADMAAPTPWEA